MALVRKKYMDLKEVFFTVNCFVIFLKKWREGAL